MKKYSREWKLENGKKGWAQKHSDGKIYHHYIRCNTEYSRCTGWGSVEEGELFINYRAVDGVR